MSRKNTLNRFQNISAGSMTGTTTITSVPTNIQFLDNIGIELDWTGTPTGTFNIQVSASYQQDQEGNVLNSGTWNSITLNPSPAASGSAGSYYVDLNQLSSPWIRVQYVNTSGTGTLNSYICGKEV